MVLSELRASVVNIMGITVQNITKSYNGIKAIENISFEVKEGELFGLIGPDGAGKTTIFRILTTLLLPDSGSATVAGFNILDYKSIRKCVGYMPGRFSLYQDLTVEENLNFYATIFGTTVQQNYELIKDIYEHIEPFKNRRAAALSGGMKQKLALCCALIHKPKVLFLDEPTTGVDPVSRKEFWEMLKRLQRKGISILVSTAYMDEAGLCDRVALIQNGKILHLDTTENITHSFPKKVYALKTKNTYQAINDLENYKHTHSIYPFGEYLHYIDEREGVSMNELNDYLIEKGHQEVEIKLIQPSIEDSFMELSKQSS